MKKLLFFWNELKATFWFVPTLIILFSILLAIGIIYLDGFVSLSQEGIGRFLFVYSADSARSILSTISGAMIGVAGTVFSVTLVALTLASSQLGPRLIKNFMYIRLNQVVLGSYIATYLYCLIVLNTVKENNGDSFIPSISILLAILAAIVNIILLIVFIHHIAISIQADKVISDISAFISKRIKILFPEKMGDEMDDEKDLPVDAIKAGYHHMITVKSDANGYLQYIDSESLLNMITGLDALLELTCRPGDYLVEDIDIGKLYTNDTLEKEDREKILLPFVVGKTKTAQQDLEFSIHQMVEIAVRALSPGVNDPYTAIACIDNLTSAMCYLVRARFPSKYRVDDKNQLRVIADTLDFEGVLDAAFNQIRQFSAGSPAVIIRLMEVLTIIHEFAVKKSHKKALVRHAQMTLQVGRDSIKEKNDLKDLKRRAGIIVGK
ncbi:MAG: DUF2254 domain-containing protein [Bacteroidales bacterium]|nr:DUF2254 domain-containing protein [Bacteroidales bacterium]MBN2699794.1 DUF2254 domain-containing protein [Bacteroidales bacterium]